jgi:hypothetical protein
LVGLWATSSAMPRRATLVARPWSVCCSP